MSCCAKSFASSISYKHPKNHPNTSSLEGERRSSFPASTEPLRRGSRRLDGQISPYSVVVDFAVTPKLSIASKPFRELLLPSKPRKHHSADRGAPRDGARHGRRGRAPGAPRRGALLRGVLEPAARRRGRGSARRAAGARRAQPRRPQPRARHGEVPGQGRRRRVPRRLHAVRRQAHGHHARRVMRRIKPDFFMDSKSIVLNTNQEPRTAVLFGPKLLAEKLYDQSPPEDLTLATMLVRPGTNYIDDPIMKDQTLLTDGHYGSEKRAFVVAMDDASSDEELQRWTIDMSPGVEVEEIAGADHMAMCSKPRELCDVLLRIAAKYE